MVYPSAPTFRSFAQCASLHTAKVIRRSFRGAGRVASAPPPDQARAARAFASSSRASLDGRSAPVTCRSARFARRPQVHPSGNATVRTYATFGSAGSAGPPRAPNGKATPPSHGTAMSRSRVAISARAATCDPCRYSPSGQSAAPSSAGSGRQSKYSEALYGAGRAKHESPAPLARLRQLGPLTDDNLLIFRDRTPKGRHYTERPGAPPTRLQDSSFGAGCFGNAKSS